MSGLTGRDVTWFVSKPLMTSCKHIWLHLGFCPTRLLSGYRWIIHWKNRKPTPLNAFIPAIITILNVFLAQILLQKKSAAYLLLTMRGLPWAMTDQWSHRSMLSLHWDKHLKPNWWSCTNDNHRIFYKRVNRKGRTTSLLKFTTSQFGIWPWQCYRNHDSAEFQQLPWHGPMNQTRIKQTNKHMTRWQKQKLWQLILMTPFAH